MRLIDTDKLKSRLARWIAKIVYRISTYDGSDSGAVLDDSSTVPEQHTKPETKPETQDTAPEAPETKPTETTGITIVSFGSPNCSKASEDPNTQIKDLKMSKSGLSYKWAKGDLSNWGIKDKHSAKALAVAGYGDGKKFRCAKFDWISSDRLTRDFNNINGGYNGFKASEFWAAKQRCFFIMDEKGTKRTNVLTV